MDEEKEVAAATKWQGWAAIVMAIIAVGAIIYDQSQNNSVNTITLQNHTSQIAALQTAVNNEQVLLYSINAQLTGLNQKLDDMQQISGHR